MVKQKRKEMEEMKKVLVCGAGGFIGSHLVKRLKNEGCWVRGVDLKYPEYSSTQADEFIIGDLRKTEFCNVAIDQKFDEIYQLAADMGGAGFIFTGMNDADILHNSATINLNILNMCKQTKSNKIFFSSSACVYPMQNQEDSNNPNCEESTAFPANPDSEYGWEKLFSERLYLSYAKNYDLDVRIARYHNIFGEEGTWQGGREKVIAALCRKIAKSQSGNIAVWGDGKQTRSFLYIDECIEGTIRLMNSGYENPVNIGSEEMITINKLAEKIIFIAKENIDITHITGPQGVRGRRSDNALIKKILGWEPSLPLHQGLEKTYKWISHEIKAESRYYR